MRKIIDKDLELNYKHFRIEFVNTTHSIPDSFAIAIHTPNGLIFETGDFKFDLTPIGPMADLHKMARVGSEGVKLLLSDSTNALSSGFSKSESTVDEALGDIFSKVKYYISYSIFLYYVCYFCMKFGYSCLVKNSF